MGKYKKNRNGPPADQGLATTVKVDASPQAFRLKRQGLGQRISGMAQRFLPLKRPAAGLAPHHRNRPSPHIARQANMAAVKSNKLNFKKFRFSIVFALVLGLAAAGGYSVMSTLSRSFHKVSDVFDSNRWGKLVKGKPAHEGRESMGSRASFASRPNSSYAAPKQQSVTQGRSHKSPHVVMKKVRDPFYKVHNPISKKHAVKHRKWSKKLAKIKKGTVKKYQQASVRYRKHKAPAR